MQKFTNTRQLRLLLGLFFLALTVPSMILVAQAYSQLRWEGFYQYRNLAEELSARVDNRFSRLLRIEESRAFAEYNFLVVSGTPQANYLQPSPLARYPVESDIPGLIGYFQLDTQGHFSTPLLPEPASQAINYGVSPAESAQRQQLQGQLLRILSDNQLVQTRLTTELDDKAALAYEEPAETRSSTATMSGASHSPAGVRRVEHEDAVSLDEVVAIAAAPEPQQSRGEKTAPQDSTANFEQLKNNYAPTKQQQKLDALSEFGRVADLNLYSRYDQEQSEAADAAVASTKREVRKEQTALPIAQAPSRSLSGDVGETSAAEKKSVQVEITLFESEINPFEFALLDSGHFVIYRIVWRGGERTIQGAIIEQQPFLLGLIEPLFRETGLSQMSDLAVAYQGSVFAAFGGVSGRDYLSRDPVSGGDSSKRGELLYQFRLSAPFSNLELFYSINNLPLGQGATVIVWAALILAIVLLGGLLLMYRLGLRQIALARQQQDFVSAVSHELKTPLTSIRMYSEMLREGWVDPQKQRSYYDFIFDESERLSRLIANVLQLARMERTEFKLELKPTMVHTLLDTIRSKLDSQIESAGFTMTLNIQEQARDILVEVNQDSFTQVLINLVDNAIKFSANTDTPVVDISASLNGSDEISITVRDYGPGVPKTQMKKIFRLFYRSETELTRETVGTGIGLALVHQQVTAMGGKVHVVNREPGAEFVVTLKKASV